jgi:hypothetical protein
LLSCPGKGQLRLFASKAILRIVRQLLVSLIKVSWVDGFGLIGRGSFADQRTGVNIVFQVRSPVREFSPCVDRQNPLPPNPTKKQRGKNFQGIFDFIQPEDQSGG